jgi:hypothetical protein
MSNKAHIIYLNKEGSEQAIGELKYLGTVPTDSDRDVLTGMVVGNAVLVSKSESQGSLPALYHWSGAEWELVASTRMLALLAQLLQDSYTATQIDNLLEELGIRPPVESVEELPEEEVDGVITVVKEAGESAPTIYIFKDGIWHKASDPAWGEAIDSLAVSLGQVLQVIAEIKYWKSPVLNVAGLNAVENPSEGEIRLVKSDSLGNTLLYRRQGESWFRYHAIPSVATVAGLNSLISNLTAGQIKNGIVFVEAEQALYWYKLTEPVGWIKIGGGGSNQIGTPTDGGYTDGLYAFTASTLISDAIDQLNKFAKSQAPPSPPALTAASVARTTKNPVKLSYDLANIISGVVAANIAQNPAPVTVDQLFNASGLRLGSSPLNGGDVTGVLNDQVAQSTQGPTPAYPADSFAPADVGVLELYLNGVLRDSFDFALNSAYNGTASNTKSGFIVSARMNTKYGSGVDAPSQYRTGTFVVKAAELLEGYNYVRVLFNGVQILYTDLVVDSANITPSFSGAQLLLNGRGTPKNLSGVYYDTSLLADYAITVSGAHRNTYSPDVDAINFVAVGGTIPAIPLPATAGNEARTVEIAAPLTFTSPLRLLKEPISVVTRVKKPNISGGLAQSSSTVLNNLLYDTFNNSSTELVEGFDDEVYRLPRTVNYESLVRNISEWDSEQSLLDGAAGYTDGLQVIGSSLIYPGKNPSFPTGFAQNNIANAHPANNGGTKGTARNYAGTAGIRYYERWFRNTQKTSGNFRIKVDGDPAVSFVNVINPLVGNNVRLYIKLPSQTGWLDAYSDFNTAEWSDNSGARSLSAGAGGVNQWLGLTVGTKNTANSGNLVLIRIVTSEFFTAKLTGIQFEF